MGLAKKHHYIPVFYLKRWAGDDGKVCEFSKPYRHVVRPRRVHPNGTGYVEGLYTLKGLPPKRAQVIEEQFFSPADSAAAEALDLFHTGSEHGWSTARKSGWSRFLMSLLLRTPEDLALLKEIVADDYLSLVPADDDAPPEHRDHVLDRGGVGILPGLVDNRNLGKYLNNMQWRVVDTSGAAYELLTSDRPLILTNGLDKPESYLLIPIGPRKLFIACNGQRIVSNLVQRGLDALVGDVNNTVAKYAVKYVWGRDDRQLRFLQNRLSTEDPPSIVAQIKDLRTSRKG